MFDFICMILSSSAYKTITTTITLSIGLHGLFMIVLIYFKRWNMVDRFCIVKNKYRDSELYFIIILLELVIMGVGITDLFISIKDTQVNLSGFILAVFTVIVIMYSTFIGFITLRKHIPEDSK